MSPAQKRENLTHSSLYLPVQQYRPAPFRIMLFLILWAFLSSVWKVLPRSF